VTYDSTDDSSVTTLGRRARDFPEIYMEFLFQTNVLTTCHACIHTYVRKHMLLVFSTTLRLCSTDAATTPSSITVAHIGATVHPFTFSASLFLLLSPPDFFSLPLNGWARYGARVPSGC
jgi:hypothetical protein